MKTQTFYDYLKSKNMSENTIIAYVWTIDYFNSHYSGITKSNLLAYKGYLMECFKPKTVNLRIQAINKYLTYLGKERLHLKSVKIQQKNFLENVISNADYLFLKKQLKKEHNLEWICSTTMKQLNMLHRVIKLRTGTAHVPILFIFTPLVLTIPGRYKIQHGFSPI